VKDPARELVPLIGSLLSRIRRMVEATGVVFIPENGGGAGVRLAKRQAGD
jgi:hypothetical protein